MNLEKLNPWNWFKHEEGAAGSAQVPVTQGDSGSMSGVSGPSSLLRLHHNMDRWFDDAFSSFGMPSTTSSLLSRTMPEMSAEKLFRPQIDVSGDNNQYEIALDVPDMSESDLSIKVKDDMLVIKGQKEAHSENKDKQFYRVERSYGSFQRTLSLPDDANADEIKAELDKGVLRLQIPRRESVSQTAKQIPISS